MSPIWWIIAAVALLVVEMVTPGLFFFACLGAGALVAALAAALGAPAGLVWTTFFLTSIALVLVVTPLAKRFTRRLEAHPVGLDALRGQRVLVVASIDLATGQGQVRVTGGALWRAFAEQDIPEGTWVDVLGVVGTRLKVALPLDTTTLLPKE